MCVLAEHALEFEEVKKGYEELIKKEKERKEKEKEEVRRRR